MTYYFRAMWLNFPGLCVILFLCCLIGIVVYGLYGYCDPFKFGLIKSSDQVRFIYCNN